MEETAYALNGCEAIVIFEGDEKEGSHYPIVESIGCSPGTRWTADMSREEYEEDPNWEWIDIDRAREIIELAQERFAPEE